VVQIVAGIHNLVWSLVHVTDTHLTLFLGCSFVSRVQGGGHGFLEASMTGEAEDTNKAASNLSARHAGLSSDCWQTSESLPEHWHHFGHTTHSDRPSHLRLWGPHLRILPCKCSAVQHVVSTNIWTSLVPFKAQLETLCMGIC